MRIENVSWLTPDGVLERGAIGWKNGRFGAGDDHDGATIDGTGLVALPGLVDAHVHFREPGLEHKEGIDSGTRCALAGGVTTVLEMPNTVPPTATPEALAEKRALYARKSRVHWGLHAQATIPPVAMPTDRIASAKIYMAKSSVNAAIFDQPAIEAIFRAFPRVAVHAEDESKLCAALPPPPGARPGRMHHLVRPVEAIVSALTTLERALIALPERQRPRLVLCHVATREELAWVRRMKASGFDVWAETCPHYLLLTQDDYVRLGDDLKVNPPLRSVADREAVTAALGDGGVDFVSTDHAPHRPDEKAQAGRAPSGIASIEVLAPLLWSTLPDRAWLQRLCVSAPTRAYGIRDRDGIRPGNLADLVLLRPGTVRREVLTGARTHPYVDRDLGFHVAKTFVAGHLAYDEGSFPSAPTGQEVFP